MASFKFIPAILRPTRITEFTATLIDYIYTNSNQIMDSDILIEDISSSSAGVDDINPSIARSSISLVATPLSWIINSFNSFNLGLVPDSLKIVKIIPHFQIRCEQFDY